MILLKFYCLFDRLIHVFLAKPDGVGYSFWFVLLYVFDFYAEFLTVSDDCWAFSLEGVVGLPQRGDSDSIFSDYDYLIRYGDFLGQYMLYSFGYVVWRGWGKPQQN